jgi:hypothetical protein
MIRVGKDIQDTARKVDLAEVVAHKEDGGHVKAVLERFARPEARIVTLASEPDGTITVRLTHEALLDRWQQLDEWLTPEAREDLLFHYRLEEQARYWHRKERPGELLWPRRDLEALHDFEQRGGGDMTAVQRAFFEASYPKESKRPGQGTVFWKSPAFLGSLAATLALVTAGLWQRQQSLTETLEMLTSPQRVPSVIELPLLPTRGGDPRIELPPGTTVTLSLSLAGIPEYPTYSLRIENLESGTQTRTGEAPPVEGRLLVFMPSGFLQTGEHRLTLFGHTKNHIELRLVTRTLSVH